MPERLLRTATQELCGSKQMYECAALLAAWQHRRPNSESLRETLANLRRSEHRTQLIGVQALGRVAALFDGRLFMPEADESLNTAVQVSSMYLDYFHYAEPFDRRLLNAAWQQCRDARCKGTRQKVEAKVGRIVLAATANRARQGGSKPQRPNAGPRPAN